MLFCKQLLTVSDLESREKKPEKLLASQTYSMFQKFEVIFSLINKSSTQVLAVCISNRFYLFFWGRRNFDVHTGLT